MAGIKSYDLDITLTVEPFIDPVYNAKQVHGFYVSGDIPPQYLKDLDVFYGNLLNKLFDAMPYVDTICVTPGVEGAQYGGGSGHAVRLFLENKNLKACTQVMGVTLDAASRVA